MGHSSIKFIHDLRHIAPLGSDERIRAVSLLEKCKYRINPTFIYSHLLSCLQNNFSPSNNYQLLTFTMVGNHDFVLVFCSHGVSRISGFRCLCHRLRHQFCHLCDRRSVGNDYRRYSFSAYYLCTSPLHFHFNLPSQVIVAIFNVITDILCCRCCGSRRRYSSSTRTGRRGGYYRRRRGYNDARYAY